MLITKFRSSIALVVAAFSIATAVGPITAAHAEDSGGDEISQEEACALLEDSYNQSAQYASDARAAGDNAGYQFWSDQAAGAYLDAELDWQCDWATAMRPPRIRWGGIVGSLTLGAATGSAGGITGPISPPASAAKNAQTYTRWLRSKGHRAMCTNLNTLTKAVEQQANLATQQGNTNGAADFVQQAHVIYVSAHFGHCTWALHLPPPTVSTGTVTPPSGGPTVSDPSGGTTTGGPTGPTGGTGGPVSTTGTIAPPPSGTAGPSDGGTSTPPPGGLM